MSALDRAEWLTMRDGTVSRFAEAQNVEWGAALRVRYGQKPEPVSRTTYRDNPYCATGRCPCLDDARYAEFLAAYRASLAKLAKRTEKLAKRKRR